MPSMAKTRWLLSGLILSCAPAQTPTTEAPTVPASRVPDALESAEPLPPPVVEPLVRLLPDSSCVTLEPDAQPAVCPLSIFPDPTTVRERSDDTCVVVPADVECDWECLSEADPVPCPETLYEADALGSISLRPDGTCWEWHPRPVHPHAPRRVQCPRELLPEPDPELTLQPRPDGTCWQGYATRVQCPEGGSTR